MLVLGGGAGPFGNPTFAFHVVVHLILHLAGPEEEAALQTDGRWEAAVATAVESVLEWGVAGWWGGEGREQGCWGTGFSGGGELGRKRLSQPVAERDPDKGWTGWGEALAHVLTLPDRPQRPLLVPGTVLGREAEPEARGDRESEQGHVCVGGAPYLPHTPASLLPSEGERKGPALAADGLSQGQLRPEMPGRGLTSSTDPALTQGPEKGRCSHREIETRKARRGEHKQGLGKQSAPTCDGADGDRCG